MSAALPVLGCLSVRTICSSGAIVLPPCWAISLHVDIFVWRVPGECSVNLSYRVDRGRWRSSGHFLHEKKQIRGDTDWACHLVDCLSLWIGSLGGVGVGWVMHYKAISKLKPRLLSFIYLFICERLRGAAGDHSELASICRDGGPGTSALPCLACPPTCTQPAPPLPLLPSSPITLRLFTLHCQTADLHLSDCSALWSLFWGERQHSFWQAGSLCSCLFYATLQEADEKWMKLLSLCSKSFSFFSFLQFSFKRCFHLAVLSQLMCVNLILWTRSVYYCILHRFKKLRRVGIDRRCVLFILDIISHVYWKSIFSKNYSRPFIFRGKILTSKNLSRKK